MQMIGHSNGRYLAAVARNGGVLTVGGVNASSATDGSHVYVQYGVNDTTSTRRVGDVVRTTAGFVPSSQPWYAAAVTANGSTYVEYGDSGSGSSAALSAAFAVPTFDESGRVVAVSGAEVDLGMVQRMVLSLGDIAGSSAGRALLVSRTGVLLGCSNAAATFGCVCGFCVSLRWGHVPALSPQSAAAFAIPRLGHCL